MADTVILPEMGEGVSEATILNWFKQEGDHVEEDEVLLEVETDKVTVEIAAEQAGTLLKIHAAVGEVVAVGTVLATVGTAGEAVADSAPVAASQPGQASTTPIAASQPTPAIPDMEPTSQPSRQMSPVVSRMVTEHNLDITRIQGTGRNGRITKRDVEAYLEAGEAPAPTANGHPAQTAAAPSATNSAAVRAEAAPMPMSSADRVQNGEVVPLTGMRRIIAEHMVMSKRTSPHVTTVFEFDYSQVVQHRQAHKAQFARDGVKLTYLPYLVLATVEALKAHPMVNASWTDEGILLKSEVHIGIAVAVDRGLVVPVIRHADEKNLFGLARAVNDLADRARSNQLKPDELRGGTFSITNHGASGSLIGTPIINQPQVGILGIGQIEKRVKVINDAIAIRPCAYVSFSFDHRILDGASADAFVMSIKQRIESFEE